jgi:hypothetical protein
MEVVLASNQAGSSKDQQTSLACNIPALLATHTGSMDSQMAARQDISEPLLIIGASAPYYLEYPCFSAH